ncbi:endonuclease, partial [candidate division KSB1 bacterium]|nr:endonuclease [candidate division KSB1 bacterium]
SPRIIPNPMLSETKIPDSTPGIIAKYALNDEQALLAKLRYNRMIDIFTGITCYSLQNHLRTTVKEMGQIETDELYVGIDRKGVQYVLPVQAKGGNDQLNIIQIEQDFAMCTEKFRNLICIPIAAQFIDENLIALFSFENGEKGISISSEKHYRLVPHEELTDEELISYRNRPK